MEEKEKKKRQKKEEERSDAKWAETSGAGLVHTHLTSTGASCSKQHIQVLGNKFTSEHFLGLCRCHFIPLPLPLWSPSEHSGVTWAFLRLP